MVQLVLLFISISPLFALSPSEQETSLAISCVNDAVFVAANYFISDIKPENPNIILRTPKNSQTSDAIVFNNLDMSTLLSSFPSKELDSTNMVSSLKEPIAPYVRDVLLTSDWQENQATILGAIAIAFKDNYTVAQVVSNMVQGIYPRMGLVTDITVRGESFSQDINIKGVFILEEDMGTLDIVPLQITINGEEFDVYSL
jgi:hypothetical protein